MPESVAKTVSEGVFVLHSNTAGGRVRFVTDSPYVAIHSVMDGILEMSHFALTGSAGFDLYADNRYVKSFVPPFDIENVDIPFNQWYSPENKPKGAQSIKINITEDILNGILDKTIDVTKYIFLLAISYYLIKIEKFKDVVDIDDDENSIMADAIELLLKHKFYSLTAKSNALDAAASHEEQLELLNSFDKKNYELVNSILRKIQLISDDDIKTTNKYLECFYKNLDWDLGFTFKIISLEFYRLENKGYSVKKELVDKIEKLVNEYIEIYNNKTLIEKY